MSLAGVPTQLLSMGCECSFLLLLLAWNVRPHKTGRHRWICGSNKSDWRANRRPSVGHKRSSPRQIRRFTNSRAEPKILQQLPVTLKPLFVCGYHVSTRKGELKNIVWPQVDFDESVIVLEPADTKTGKGRYLPIYGDMGEWLTKQKAVRDAEFPECPWVFFWHTADCVLGHGGVRTKPGSHVQKFDASWKAAVKRAGNEGLLFKDLRRSAQRHMRKAGIDQSIRMKISGHKTDSMERRYNIVDIEDVKSAAKQMAKWIKGEKAKKEKGKT